jgi:hypothetical protein
VGGCSARPSHRLIDKPGEGWQAVAHQSLGRPAAEEQKINHLEGISSSMLHVSTQSRFTAKRCLCEQQFVTEAVILAAQKTLRLRATSDVLNLF